MIITAILQVKNEESSGHLARFLKWNMPLIDNLVAYDDCSTDKTVELLETFGAQVVSGSFNSFQSELNIKDLLLQKSLELYPETNWILWLDADELLLESREELDKLLIRANETGFDGVQLPLVNLWRSEMKFRIDSRFNDLENVRLWRNNGSLRFMVRPGLHQLMHPVGMRKILRHSDLSVLHFGFAYDSKILSKFHFYQLSGQRGRNLWRLVDESSLELADLDSYSARLGGRFSDWRRSLEFKPDSVNSSKLLDSCHFQPRVHVRKKKPVVTLISLIYVGIDWLEFQYGELLKLQSELGKEEVEILFVANDPSHDVLTFLKTNSIPYVVAPGRTDNSEWYINSVYRAYNFGVANASGEYVLLTNSDMAYAPGFLYELLKRRNTATYLVGKLIESGRLTPAKAALKKNLGKKLSDFKRGAFYRLARRISKEGISDGGLYMPLLIHRESFLDFGGYPEGNILKTSLLGYLKTGNYEVARQGEDLLSGDSAFVKRLQSSGWTFNTVNSAIAYHFQEGEKSEYSDSLGKSSYSGVYFDKSLLKLSEHFNSKINCSSKKNCRLLVTSSIVEMPNDVKIILISDDFASIELLDEEDKKNILACITSDVHVLRSMAIVHDIHAYFIPVGFESGLTEESVRLIDEILEHELEITFFPVEPISIRTKLRKFLPRPIKVFINWIRS